MWAGVGAESQLSYAAGWLSGARSTSSLVQRESPKSKLEVWKKWAQEMPLQAISLLGQVFPLLTGMFKFPRSGFGMRDTI